MYYTLIMEVTNRQPGAKLGQENKKMKSDEKRICCKCDRHFGYRHPEGYDLKTVRGSQVLHWFLKFNHSTDEYGATACNIRVASGNSQEVK